MRAVHVNHGLHPNAPLWSEHCRTLARQLSVPLEIMVTRVRKVRGASIEAAARDARYGLLGEALQPGEILLTAHHEDDQLETVLLQLFRGAGLAGLAAMPDLAPFASGLHARPLLSRTRLELEQWVHTQGLPWIEDDTNADEAFDRNYLRRRVLPLVRERWPGVGLAVSRAARHVAEGQRLLQELARRDVERAADGQDLSVKTLRALQMERRRNALRYWITKAGARAPDSTRLAELAGPVIEARPDANPHVSWSGAQVRRHADLLSIVIVAPRRGRAAGSGNPPGTDKATSTAEGRFQGDRLNPAFAPASSGRPPLPWSWRKKAAIDLPDDEGVLELKRDAHGPIDLDALPDPLVIRWRTGGEKLRPRRSGPRRALKSLLQEAQLSIAERASLPLLYFGSTLLAAGDRWLDAAIQAAPGAAHRCRLHWRRTPRRP